VRLRGGWEEGDAMSQGEGGPKPPGAITIDQLLALNAEIAALVRAGVPLERGLVVAGREVRGRLGRIATALSARLSRGESLPEALEHERQAIPPLYRAVVEAGARCGRLPIALEGLASYVRGYSEARAAIGLALWYPLLVLALAYALFVGLVTFAVPRFVEGFGSLGLDVAAPLRWLSWIGEWASYWWPVGPILLVVLIFAWARSGAAARFGARSWSWLKLFPWMRSILANYESANFAELLGLLLEHRVPYSSAIVLAAESTGNPRIAEGARQLSEAVARGESAATALGKIDRRTFLPMMRWVLATGQEQGSLVAALHNLADVYRKRAQFQADKLTVFLPTILMIVIGASATLFYGLALFIPLANLLRELTLP
jgi:type II secretory pathway component PulF